MPKNQCNWNRVFFNTSLAVRSKIVFTARIMPWVIEKRSLLRTKAPFN
jgi:hypothetical protein